MQPTQTGIAVALAVAIVFGFFLFPNYIPFSIWPQDTGAAATTAPAADTSTDTSVTSAPMQPATTEPNQPNPAPMTITDNGQLQIKDEVVGTGAAAAAGDTVTVNYVGELMNGTVFDASKNHGDQGFTFALGAGQVIKGWDQGIVGMKEGGKRLLVIPAALAYGNQAVGGVIPANATLVFEVELLKVQKGQ